MSELTLDQRAMQGANLAIEKRKQIWLSVSPALTAEKLDAFLAHEKQRQALVPPIGAAAPDFALDTLDRTRRRTGETVRLSDLRGRPLGLVFGSYT